jgi:hypothetical protein
VGGGGDEVAEICIGSAVFAAVVEVRIPVFEAVEFESEVRLRIGGLVRALESLDVDLMSNWLLEASWKLPKQF